MPQRFYIGIPTSRMNTVYAAQRNTQWCWAAAIEMILRYYGIEISQEAIVYRAYGLDWRGQPPNREATYEAMAKNLNDWGIDFKGQFFVVRASFHWGPPPLETLMRELSAQRPVLLSYISRTFPRLAGHAVVATALQIEQLPPPGISGAAVFVQNYVVLDRFCSSEAESCSLRTAKERDKDGWCHSIPDYSTLV